MKMSSKLKAFVEEAKKSDEFWVERAKLDFALALEKQRRAVDMTYAAIAEKIKSSKAYMSKVFRGDSNLTIESMVKLARATGGTLDIQIVHRQAEAPVWTFPPSLGDQLKARHTVAAETSVQTHYVASNNERWELTA